MLQLNYCKRVIEQNLSTISDCDLELFVNCRGHEQD